MRAPRTKSICGHIQWGRRGGGRKNGLLGRMEAMCHVCQRQCSCCCSLFLKIGFCWFARQLFSRRQPPATSGWGPNDKDNKHIQLEAEQAEQAEQSEWRRRRFQCPPTGSWSGVLFVVRLSITNFYCNLLLFRARSSHSATMWTHFEVVSKRGRGRQQAAGHCVCLSMCVCAAMFYVQVFNIVFDEVISICCLMNCNGWLCHQITIALLEFHWYIWKEEFELDRGHLATTTSIVIAIIGTDVWLHSPEFRLLLMLTCKACRRTVERAERGASLHSGTATRMKHKCWAIRCASALGSMSSGNWKVHLIFTACSKRGYFNISKNI